MPLSWNEIKDRAIRFSKEWSDTTNEDAEAKSFIEAFFGVFGISRKRVATFEHRVKKLDESDGYIDLLWKGTILIEMKSRGKNLDMAFIQAKEYTHGLKDHELPKYILVSDFYIFRLFDMEENKTTEFTINEFVNNVGLFSSIAGYIKHIYKEQDPVNIKAAELMGKLHDRLKDIGYSGHPLELYLVRLLFCLFADDTTIFEKQQFQDFIEQRTNEDGSDLAAKIQELFQVLNTPADKRFKNLDEQLKAFPYVNGKLFEEPLPMASFDAKMRQTLLECCYIDWAKISPAIFGSMFQSVMNPKERRNLGAHYTSEKNILKLIKPLFLDELWLEFQKVKGQKNKLIDFHKKLRDLKFLDPACGCGNFLVITYRELRLLELELIKELLRAQNIQLYSKGYAELHIDQLVKINVDQFYGIEYEEFPARIAEVAMWLIDHQMNMEVSTAFGNYFSRLPLAKCATIVHGNSLQMDWSAIAAKNVIDIEAEETNVFANEPGLQYDIVNVYSKSVNVIDKTSPPVTFPGKASYNYILGNPPFVGKSFQNAQQKNDLNKIFAGVKGAGVLDYVTAWYVKAAQLMQNTNTKAAFVSTNSIAQGEQVGTLWNLLFNLYKIKIHFAHRTFSWSNEAKGNAAVHVVIIGFANYDTNNKTIFEYADIKAEPHQLKVKNINPYLIEGKDNVVLSRTKPICNVPNIVFGSMPNDGGFLILSKLEKEEYIINEPNGEKFIKQFTGGEEFINNFDRYCFWLKNIDPSVLRSLPILMSKISKVKEYRLKSQRETTKKLSYTPTLFGEIRQPNSKYIIIPNLSSNIRKYIPIGFKNKEVIASNLALIIPDANIFHFGILTSEMHMTWVKYVCGRLGSGFRYSNKIVYNNFPWCPDPSEKQIKSIETSAQKVLDVRAEFPGCSLADLYDPLTMPPALVKAHQELDKAVDLAYRPQPFITEAKRMEYLFELYEKYIADLFTKEKPKKKQK